MTCKQKQKKGQSKGVICGKPLQADLERLWEDTGDGRREALDEQVW
jgi:hypothetical protein